MTHVKKQKILPKVVGKRGNRGRPYPQLTSNQSVVNDLKRLLPLALEEDIGDGDISTELLADKSTSATVITRQKGIYCGELWIQAVIEILEIDTMNNPILIQQHKKDGEVCQENEELLSLKGNLRQLLNIERTLLNGLQLLCGIATKTAQFVQAIQDLNCQVLDTRKTIPGWRKAQKYAVRMGGGKNHRMGLYDAYLLKENHQRSHQNIIELITEAKRAQKKLPICVEVESIQELKNILPSQPNQILLDNFSLSQLKEAVEITQAQQSSCLLEASGNIDSHNIREVAETGVHCISIGALTKHVQAMDLSMQLFSSSHH